MCSLLQLSLVFTAAVLAWAQDPASTEAADVKGVCSKPQLDAARTKLLEAFAGLAVQLPEKLDLRNVSTKEYSMFGGSMSGMRFLNISGDVDASCEPKQSVFLFTAVAQQVKGRFDWRFRSQNILTGTLELVAGGVTFRGRLRLNADGSVDRAALEYSDFTELSTHLKGSSSAAATRVVTAGIKSFVKSLDKFTKDLVSPAFKRVLT